MKQEVMIYFNGMRKKCTKQIDHNGETIFESADGWFVKFPQTDNIEELIKKYNEANKKAPNF